MKIVKLNNRYVLGKGGFTYALRFRYYYNKNVRNIEQKLHDIHGIGWWSGSRWFNPSKFMWATHLNQKSREYYIGVRDEKDLTAIILLLEHV